MRLTKNLALGGVTWHKEEDQHAEKEKSYG